MAAGGAAGPPTPTTLEATGLALMQIYDLVLNQLYLQGNLIGVQIARHARLPFQIIEEALCICSRMKNASKSPRTT